MVLSLMGAPNTDMELIQWTLDKLQMAGRPTKVMTGKTPFKSCVGTRGKV